MNVQKSPFLHDFGHKHSLPRGGSPESPPETTSLWAQNAWSNIIIKIVLKLWVLHHVGKLEFPTLAKLVFRENRMPGFIKSEHSDSTEPSSARRTTSSYTKSNKTAPTGQSCLIACVFARLAMCCSRYRTAATSAVGFVYVLEQYHNVSSMPPTNLKSMTL